jgi:hypothetical protein
VRHASRGVFSVPVLTGNQGSAPTAAGDVTVDDAACPRLAIISARPRDGDTPCIAHIAVTRGTRSTRIGFVPKQRFRDARINIAALQRLGLI